MKPAPYSNLKNLVEKNAVLSRLLRKLRFDDVIYLVLCRHPVMMTCHSSLFCALYVCMSVRMYE